jgi:hypothetical protein
MTFGRIQRLLIGIEVFDELENFRLIGVLEGYTHGEWLVSSIRYACAVFGLGEEDELAETRRVRSGRNTKPEFF